jgi:hypothetical protein
MNLARLHRSGVCNRAPFPGDSVMLTAVIIYSFVLAAC